MILQMPMPPIPLDPGTIGLIVVFSLVAATIILWPLARALARRLVKGTGDATLKAEVEHLHQRLGEVDALQGRLAELEERLDFTERMLARAPEAPAQLHRGEVP